MVTILHVHIITIIIQQIVTMPIYGQEAFNICHLHMTDIQLTRIIYPEVDVEFS